MEKITCPNCSTENPGTSRYCLRCGHALPVAVAETVPEETAPSQQAFKKKSKISWQSVVGIVVGISVMTFVQQRFFAVPSFDKVMMKVADELNKTAPVMVDSVTRFDNAMSLPDNVFQYNYTVLNLEKSMVVDTVAAKEMVEGIIVPTVKTNPQMEELRKHKTTLNYCYKDKFGRYLFTVVISADKYE